MSEKKAVATFYTLTHHTIGYRCSQCGQNLAMAMTMAKQPNGGTSVVSFTVGCRCDRYVCNLTPFGIIPVETPTERQVEKFELHWPEEWRFEDDDEEDNDDNE